MSTFKISCSGGLNTLPSPWADLKKDTTSAITLLDETETDVGVTVRYTAAPAYEVSTLTAAQPGTGDASWVIAEALEGGHGSSDSVNWYAMVVEGLTPGDSYNVECFGSYDFTDTRITDFRVNNGSPQQLTVSDGSGPNLSNTVKFDGEVADANGEILIEWKEADASSGRAYVNAIQLVGAGAPAPSISITGPLQPGASISGTYSNFTGVPTALTLTDGNANSISSATEITDLNITDNGDGTGSFTFTMPALPTAGNSQSSLLFGDITAELTT